jgi:hypothetical protein
LGDTQNLGTDSAKDKVGPAAHTAHDHLDNFSFLCESVKSPAFPPIRQKGIWT